MDANADVLLSFTLMMRQSTFVAPIPLI